MEPYRTRDYTYKRHIGRRVSYQRLTLRAFDTDADLNLFKHIDHCAEREIVMSPVYVPTTQRGFRCEERVPFRNYTEYKLASVEIRVHKMPHIGGLVKVALVRSMGRLGQPNPRDLERCATLDEDVVLRYVPVVDNHDYDYMNGYIDISQIGMKWYGATIGLKFSTGYSLNDVRVTVKENWMLRV